MGLFALAQRHRFLVLEKSQHVQYAVHYFCSSFMIDDCGKCFRLMWVCFGSKDRNAEQRNSAALQQGETLGMFITMWTDSSGTKCAVKMRGNILVR